jgi:hypothetical protein
MKFAEILHGWKNYVGFDKLPNELKAVIESRIDKCLQPCENLRVNRFFILIEKVLRIKKSKGYQCSGCGCSVYAKASNEKSKCPLNKW